MRSLLGLMLAILVIIAVASGCGPAVSEEELGTVLFEVPEIPGADELDGRPKSPMPPQMGNRTAQSDEGTKSSDPP